MKDYELTPERRRVAEAEASRKHPVCARGHYVRLEGCIFCHYMLERKYALAAEASK